MKGHDCSHTEVNAEMTVRRKTTIQTDQSNVCYLWLHFALLTSFVFFLGKSADLLNGSTIPGILPAGFTSKQNSAWQSSGGDRMRELLNRTVAWKAVNGTDGLVEIPTLFDGEYEVLDDRLKDCLVGKPLGMIGMSLIRYQYLSLVNFLEHETWIPWDGGAHLGSASPVVENQWRKPTDSDKEHWNRFFQGTNRVLNGNEACDCYRSSSCTALDTHGGWCTTENRYYRKKIGHRKYLSVTYLQSFGPKYSPRGHWNVQLSQIDIQQEQACMVGNCTPPWNWVYKDAGAVIFILRRLGINRLLWYGGQEGFDNKLFMDKGHISEVDDVIFALNSISKGGGIFYDGAFKRTHPTVEAARSLYTEIMQDTLLGAGWSHLPALEIVEKLRSAFSSTYPKSVLNDGSLGPSVYEPGTFFYWDDIHYYPWVYEELNKALIHLLCSK